MLGDRPFEELFRSSDPRRDRFLARLFGLFNESVVRHWAAVPNAPYEDLGRPTLSLVGLPRGHTLDFTLRDRQTGRVFISEMKCELEYEGYRYLRLADARQLDHHRGEAFQKFLKTSRDPHAFDVRIAGRPIVVEGGILVWGAVAPGARDVAMAEFGFADVLSVEEILSDLRRWRPPDWIRWVDDLRGWSLELFDGLL